MANEDKTTAKRSPNIQSVSVAARILRLLSTSSGALALSEIARRSDLGRSTAHRYLQSLLREGLVAQDVSSGRYDLGPEALNIGVGALKRIDPIEVAAESMKSLSQSHAFSAGVAIWTERGPTLVRWYRSAYFSINPLALGDVLPIDNTACGLVFQSYLPGAMIERARQNQPVHFRGTPPDPERLHHIRETAWAELTSHLLSNVTGQAAPIFDAQLEIACVVTTVTDLGQLHEPEDRDLLLSRARLINTKTSGQAI
ncbi:IclR family transcriptional regulator [Sedimentitalea sp. XS_ASV28]|uniref:IclR family transcriptional regulator n=1 Tax=Sedimentitalea sp. XS_ASV28 TaxID=3241296 RepID=UPI003511B3EA